MNDDKETSIIIDQLLRVRKFESELGLPERFFETIKEEDDWSFVIKLHALIEASITNILKDKFIDQDLVDIFSQMELSNKRTVKMAFIKKMNLLQKEYRNFISKFSELRNLLVHEISNVTFSFKNYIDQLNKNQRKALSNALAVGVREKKSKNTSSYRLEQFIKDPKFCIWISALCLLSILTVKKDLFAIEREHAQKSAELIDSFMNL
jgi:energy-converting hydrogenase A subunit M